METRGPHVRTIPVHCAPCKAPCPACGKLLDRYRRQERAIRNRWQEEAQPMARNSSSPKTAAVDRVA
jgi:hypothetical protein